MPASKGAPEMMEKRWQKLGQS
uniref:Uncharacterized protein n=1 Tax=Rhizophora mucronata TaxID=61149 RepID=A0A2P2N337_RHIMU